MAVCETQDWTLVSLFVQRKLGAFLNNLKFSDALSSITDRINLGPWKILPPTELDLPRYALV